MPTGPLWELSISLFCAILWTFVFVKCKKIKFVSGLLKLFMISSITLFTIILIESNVKQILIHHSLARKIAILFVIQLISASSGVVMLFGQTVIVGRKSIVDFLSGSVRLLLASLFFVIFVIALFLVLMI